MQFVNLSFRAILLSLIVTFPLLFVVEITFAGDKAEVDSGIALVEKGEYEKAFRLFQRLAKEGDAEAQHNLAMLYRAGKGTEKNLELSALWFRKAADQGIADAQYYLGHMYASGEGLEQNTQYAFIWYRMAAENGQGMAQINLGVMYANGVGTAQDVEQAYLWFHVAAAQGYKAAFENKRIIEDALEPEALEILKQKESSYFKRYVLPYQRRSLTSPQLR